MVVSDHAPCPIEKKTAGSEDIREAWSGVDGVQMILRVLLSEGINKGRLSFSRLLSVACKNPAKIFGLYPAKGRLENGADADLVLFNPRRTWTISSKNQHSRAGYTLYEGWECTGKVEKVFSRGTLIVDNDTYLGQPGRGRFFEV